MKGRSLKLTIEDILDAIFKIERYTSEMNFLKFKGNDLVIDAVIRNLEIIGEASTYIPENVRNKYPELPWKRMVGLRNIAIHGYFKVDLNLIWTIITKNIPEAKKIIVKMRKELIKE